MVRVVIGGPPPNVRPKEELAGVEANTKDPKEHRVDEREAAACDTRYGMVWWSGVEWCGGLVAWKSSRVVR